jgi:pimeloyl-ACP methyl ester carboxylesterase
MNRSFPNGESLLGVAGAGPQGGPGEGGRTRRLTIGGPRSPAPGVRSCCRANPGPSTNQPLGVSPRFVEPDANALRLVLFQQAIRYLFPTLLLIALIALATSARADDVPKLKEISVTSTLDGSPQPSLLWVPESAASEARPLLVSLHSWSGDYRQDRSEWYRQAVRRDWIYLQPNFRGVNDHPEGCGSPLARQDILDATEWVIRDHKVDTERIYLAGVSGGGHMSLLMAARHPQRFSAVSAWVGISDLSEWYRFHSRGGRPQRYAQMIAASCGGPPGSSAEVDREYHERSSIHFLQQAVGLPLDINAGVLDGKTGSVPIHHSLRAFNVVAAAGGYDTIPEAEMNVLWERGRLPEPGPDDETPDETYGRDILLRRQAGAARVTIFDGTHEALPSAACEWLSQQSRPTSSTSVK